MQKEKLSALMDGETLDNELLNELERSSEMQKTWESYEAIRVRCSILISQLASWPPLKTSPFVRRFL